MSFASNTLAAGVVRRGALVRSVRAIGVAVSLAACPLAAADELQTLISTQLTSGLIDVTTLDLDSADRALAVSRAPLNADVASRSAVTLPSTGSLMAGSLMADSMAVRSIRPASRRAIARDTSVGASPHEASEILPLSRAVFPLLVGSLAVEAPAISASSASLRPLAGPVVGVRSSFLRPNAVAGR
jgi:hypothetical protein